MKVKILRSLKGKILFWFLAIFVFFALLTGLMCIDLFSNTLNKEVEKYSQSVLKQSELTIDAYFDQVKTLAGVVSNNRYVMDAMEKYHETDSFYKRISLKQEIVTTLADIYSFSFCVNDIIITDNSGLAIGNSPSGGAIKVDYNFYSQEWFPKGLDRVYQSEFTQPHPQNYYLFPSASVEKQNTVSVVTPVAKVSMTSINHLGAVICNVDINYIKDITAGISFEKTGFLLMMTQDGEIIYNPDEYYVSEKVHDIISAHTRTEEGTFEIADDKKEYLSVFCTSHVTGWKIIAMIPLNEISAHVDHIRSIVLLFYFIGILFVVLAALFISNSITRPIDRLMKQMRLIEQGNLDLKLFDNSTKEMEVLTRRIDEMVGRINSLNKDIFSYQIENKEMEYQALQAQINPHFLYNTLQLIKSSAICHKPNDVSAIVTHIGNMLRYTVYNPKEFVEIKDELEHVKNYIEIQQYRYPNCFEFVIDCPLGLEKCKTLKMILQPLVENAFVHGFKDGHGMLSIRVEETEQEIRIEVRDNGIGMNEEMVHDLNRRLEHPEECERKHSIGLQNVHNRIRLKYGELYGVRIIYSEKGGAQILLLIPKIM